MAVVIPDLSEIFEEAFERAGLEMRSGYDLKTVRRSLNMLTLEWQNRGLNLFTIESGTQLLTPGTAVYTLPTDTIDVIATYAQQTNKNTQGRPTQVYVDRGVSDVKFTLWPVPDTAYTVAYYRLKGIDGLDAGIAGSASIPPRFIPALVSGLAFHVAMKKPEAAARAPALRDEYNAQFQLAADEDGDRSSLHLTAFRGY